jgi:hypothetical protein
MFNLFNNINVDWLGKRKAFIAVSIFIMLAGLASAIGREFTSYATVEGIVSVDVIL